VNTAIFSPNGGNVGVGFAIPANQAKEIIGDLRQNGSVERGWLGVQIQEVTPEIAQKAMALAAAKIGIKTKFIAKEEAHTDES
jgi:serine protease Do